MWRKQDESKISPPPSASAASKAVAPATPAAASGPAHEASPAAGHLSKGLLVKGDISGGEDFFIGGEVHGQIRIPDGKVTIGPTGCVVAGVEAREIVVRGKVKGNLYARERVQLVPSADVTGDVVAARISIDEGATLRGHVDTMREERRAAQVAPIYGGAPASRPAGPQPKETSRSA